MRRQQQLWRQQKETQRWEEALEGGEGEESEGKQKQKYCDMCRNHGVLTKNRGHKRSCPRENCTCDLCSFTRKRRHIMQLQQKVKRSNITTQQFHEATEWVSKLTEELANLGIDDVPSIPSSIPTIPTTSSYPSHRSEGPYPSTASLFSTGYPMEPFASSATRMAPRPFLPSVTVGQYPSTTFQIESANSLTAPVDATSSYTSPNVIHIPAQESNSSSYTSLCPPSPSFSSPSASPIVDYDAPSVLSYPVDEANCEMTSTSSIARDTPSSEPLDYSAQNIHLMMRTSQAHKFGDIPANPNNSWSDEHGSMEEETQDKYWPSQRRSSEGVIHSVCSQNHQRRNSDSGLQGIYRPSQRRHSDGVIKKFYGQSQRVGDTVIRETYFPEEKKDVADDIQEQYKVNPRESGKVGEECYGAENRLLDIHHQMDQRRNSDGVISTSYRHYQRRHSDGVIRQCISVNQRGYDRTTQKNYMLNPPELSDEAKHSSYSPSDRRSSDELSQGSYLLDQRRSSIDSIQENYESDERKNSDDAIKTYYWPYQRSDSGEISHETEWPFRRRNSDEFFQGSYQINKEHFFENNLRREHEVNERIDRALPINRNVSPANDYKGHPPIVVNIQQAAVILRQTDTPSEETNMNWSEISHHDSNEHSESAEKQNYDDMDVPIDLSVKSQPKLANYTKGGQ